MAVHVPARSTRLLVVAGAALGIDRDDDALRAVLAGCGVDHVRIGDRGGIEAGLVGAGIEQPPHVFHGAHTATHGERDEHLPRDALDHVQDQVAFVARGRDVQERDLVGTLVVVARSDLDRITRVAQLDELDALDDAPAGDVQARDDAFGEGHEDSSSARACASTKSRSPE